MRILVSIRRWLREQLGLAQLEARVEELGHGSEALGEAHATLGEAHARLDEAHARLGEAHARDIARVWELLDEHQRRLARLERQVRMATVMAWIEQATLAREPLVSVIIPTRERAAFLARALESVVEQSYSNWEALVCEDGPGRATAALVASVDDSRIRHLPAEPAGVGAARNRGLDAASGELIAYLDDDNRMHRNWLKSVAWAFEQRPEKEVLHGGIVIDDTARHHEGRSGEMPSAWLEHYDPQTIAEANVADANAIAHRAGLADARWDESLETMGDWDLFLRLTTTREPLTLPAIACFYYTDADRRLSALAEQNGRDRRRVVERAHAARDTA